MRHKVFAIIINLMIEQRLDTWQGYSSYQTNLIGTTVYSIFRVLTTYEATKIIKYYQIKNYQKLSKNYQNYQIHVLSLCFGRKVVNSFHQLKRLFLKWIRRLRKLNECLSVAPPKALTCACRRSQGPVALGLDQPLGHRHQVLQGTA